MVARHLVTTALEHTWKRDRPILFLGDWCKLFSAKKRWESLDSVTVPYHWDNRQQLYRDYRYIAELYEVLLRACSDSLNNFHGEMHGLRYWRILIGPWLLCFLQVVYDRWQMISFAVKTFDISGTTVSYSCNCSISQDFNNFIQNVCSDLWNHEIYSKIIEEVGGVNIEKDDSSSSSTASEYKNIVCNDYSLSDRFKTLFSKLYFRASRKDYFFYASYFSLIDQTKLEFSLGQFPSILQKPPLSPFELGKNDRDRFRLNVSFQDNFSSFVTSLIPSQIPLFYLEGYGAVRHMVSRIPWSRKPKVIFTANAAISDDFFKAWAAVKVEDGSNLILGQHGGQYGVGKWVSIEDHEIAVSDCFFSWGWSKKGVQPLAASKLVNIQKKISHDPDGGVVLAQACGPRYSYWLYSMPVASQFKGYLEDQIRFVEQLPSFLKNKLQVRLYPGDYEWSQGERWVERIPDIRFCSCETLEQAISQSRLYIGTYNATTFLETFAADVPTILFWNPYFWEVRESAREDFDSLRNVGILYDTPEAAAEMVESIWDNVGEWWNREKIQLVRREFCRKYALTLPDWRLRWKDAFRSIASGMVNNGDVNSVTDENDHWSEQ